MWNSRMGHMRPQNSLHMTLLLSMRIQKDFIPQENQSTQGNNYDRNVQVDGHRTNP
jgi:hypothetical protein